MSDYETSVAEQTEEQIYRLKHGWGYGRRTAHENRELARAAAVRAVRIARRHPFATLDRAIPRRLITTMPSNVLIETAERWSRATDLHPDWEHVLLICDRKRPTDNLYEPDFPLMKHLWSTVRSGAQLADIVRTEELFHRGGIYIDADLEVLAPLDSLITTDFAWVPAEDSRPVPDISNFALGFPPAHTALGMLLEMMMERIPGPTWWSGPGALRVTMRERHDVSLLAPHLLSPVNWKDVPNLARIHDYTPDQLRAEFPTSLGVHLYEGSWRSGKSRRSAVDKGGH